VGGGEERGGEAEEYRNPQYSARLT
jgi:hypothetical protein